MSFNKYKSSVSCDFKQHHFLNWILKQFFDTVTYLCKQLKQFEQLCYVKFKEIYAYTQSITCMCEQEQTFAKYSVHRNLKFRQTRNDVYSLVLKLNDNRYLLLVFTI